MARILSTNIALQGTFLNQDTRSMVEQSKIWIARPAVYGALIIEYQEMLTGKGSKLSQSQRLPLSPEEIPKVRRLPDGRVPQIHSIGALE